MNKSEINFSDGEAYESSMGVWSRIAGSAFLSFLNAPAHAKWLDVGCGNGAFTELIFEHCAPAGVEGVDPAEGQVAYARKRLDGTLARVHVGRADALPFRDESFDVVTMALVLFFVPDPQGAVAEMTRVAREGGLVAAYSWDMLNGGFPYDGFQSALRELGVEPPLPPSATASQMLVMRDLWSAAGLRDVRSAIIEVTRVFENFEDFWATSCLVASLRPIVASLSDQRRQELREILRSRLPANNDGSITCGARANAVVGLRCE